MKMSTVYLGKTNANETQTISRRLILLVLLLSALFWAGGCEGYYADSPGYYGPNYGYGPGPYYGGGSVVYGVEDQLTYVRGPGIWYGSVFYIWWTVLCSYQ